VLSDNDMQTGVDRSSLEACESVFIAALPDLSCRLAAIRVLGAGIFAAHIQAPGAWSVTLFKAGLRMNVGSAEAFTISEDLVRALVLPGSAASVVPGDRLALLSPSPYRSTPRGAQVVAASAAQFASLEGWVRQPFLSFVTAASLNRAGRPRRTPFHGSHSPGVVSYLSRVLGQTLPNPVFHSVPSSAGT
jgi:hypothetical protein